MTSCAWQGFPGYRGDGLTAQIETPALTNRVAVAQGFPTEISFFPESAAGCADVVREPVQELAATVSFGLHLLLAGPLGTVSGQTLGESTHQGGY